MAYKFDDFSHLADRLKAKGGKPGNCPICGHGEWGFASGTLALTTDASAPDEDTAVVEYDAAWVITCLNCGFMRLFHVDTLLRDEDEGDAAGR